MEATLMAKHTYEKERINRSACYLNSQRALATAQERLNHEGHTYPLFTSNVSASEYLDALDDYRNREARYYHEALVDVETKDTLQDKTTVKEWQEAYD